MYEVRDFHWSEIQTLNLKTIQEGTRHEKGRFCDFWGQISGIRHIVGLNSLK